jgi:hypothetical protein
MKYISTIFVIVLLLVVTASGQRGDYMTPEEQDVVRNNQDIDARISVLAYMIDRRFIAMGIPIKANKPSPGPESEWGPEPKGTKPELLFDISHLLEKAIDDIDNLAGHLPEKAKEERKGVNLFNKAVKSLDASAKRWLPILKKEFENASDEQTHSATATLAGFCEQIIEAASKLK